LFARPRNPGGFGNRPTIGPRIFCHNNRILLTYWDVSRDEPEVRVSSRERIGFADIVSCGLAFSGVH
jgi:hypothetical protein